jgi:hypothetical protein
MYGCNGPSPHIPCRSNSLPTFYRAFAQRFGQSPREIYTRRENFVGFADDIGDRLNLDVANASCPGETTGSFLSATAADNGCRAYRKLYPLHAAYSSTQAEFATDYLKHHREVHLVTITLGANDGLLLEASCASEPTPLLVEECIEAGAPAHRHVQRHGVLR